MGFRWYKGRFLSDWEYGNVLKQESIDFWFSIGLLIPTAILGLIGYSFSTLAMWSGIIVGLLLGIFLNRLMILLGGIGIIILIILGIKSSNSRIRYFTSSEINLRNGPSTSAGIKTVIKSGDEVFFSGDSIVENNKTWYKVSYGYDQGWVSKKFLIEK